MLRWLVAAALLLTLVNTGHALTIGNDLGGRVIDYAIKAQKAKSVRFDGKCMSACTLYLSARDTCITPRASFHFHAATHPIATQFLINNYPQWVRDWIARKGGLTSQWLVMPRSHASKHMRAC
jgi:hypothetical protein